MTDLLSNSNRPGGRRSRLFPEIDWPPAREEHGLEVQVQLSDGRSVNLLEAARDMFWLPVDTEAQRNLDGGAEMEYRSPSDPATEFLVQFQAAAARMPKLSCLASEEMAPRRIVSLADGFPFEVGLLMRPHERHRTKGCSDCLHIFMETIAEEKGRINRLHCGNELSGSLAWLDPRHHSAMPYLTSLELSNASLFTSIADAGPTSAPRLVNNIRDALYKATELRELSLCIDCNSEFVREATPINFIQLLVRPGEECHIWQHLRSLKIGAIDAKAPAMLLLIKAHATTLRHLHLDQCRPATSFARELSEIDGLHLTSITISDSDVPKSGLVSEEALLRFIHGEDVGDERLAKKIGEGKFVTHNRRADDIDDKAFKRPKADLDSLSDHSSEWWSDTDSESEPETASTSQSHAGGSDWHCGLICLPHRS